MNDIDFSKIYSYSKIKLFDQCPQAYYFNYLDPVYSKMKSKLRREPENIWPFQTSGKAIHDALTLFFYLSRDQQILSELKDQLKKTWRSEAMKNKVPPLGKWGGFKDLETERRYYRQSLTMLANFYQLFDLKRKISYRPTVDLENSIEDYKELVKPISKAVDISGKFDLILEEKGGLEIVDFKTGQNEEADNFQLWFYKLLAELNFDQLVTKASFYFLHHRQRKSFDLTEIKKEAIKESILTKVKEIGRTKEFLPRPQPLCRYCLFRTFCPAKKEIAKFTQEPVQGKLIEDLPF